MRDLRDIQRESQRIRHAAGREYIRQRVQTVQREVRRETVAEIREALRECGMAEVRP